MKRLLLFLVFASVAFGQAYRVDPNLAVTTAGTVSPGGYPALYALQGANVSIFTDPAATQYATTYTDTTAGQACPAYAQVVLPGAICSNTAGPTGNFGWWLAPGNYFYTITSQGTVYGPYPVTVQQTISATNTGILNVKNPPYNAVGNGIADDTIPIANACAAAVAAGAILYFPSGTYLSDTITCPSTAGMIVDGAGPAQAIIKSRTGLDVFAPTVNGAQVHAITIKNIGINGNAGTGAGINFAPIAGGGTFNVKIDNVIITNVGGDCVDNWKLGAFETDVNHVECSSLNGNGIDIIGGPASTIRNSYVHTVGNGGVGYKCRSHCLMESDNGLDNNTNGIWMQVGTDTPSLNYGFVTLINCNIEFFGAIGIEVIEGWIDLHNVGFLASHGSTVQAIRYDATFNNGLSVFDAQTGALLTSGSWLNGVPIHAAGVCPPLVTYNNSNTNMQQCYSEGVGGTYNIPNVTNASVAFLVSAMQISELVSPDLYAVHYNSFGAAPTLSTNPSFQFGTGAVIKGFDSSGSVTVGTGGTGTVGQIVWGGTPAYRGIDVSCMVHNQKGATPVESSNVNISTISGGLSTVTQISGTPFNIGWTTGMPVLISVGGTTGTLNNQVISTVASTTSLTISPGVSGGTTGSVFFLPPRDISMNFTASGSGLNIYSSYGFVSGDVIKWKCEGF